MCRFRCAAFASLFVFLTVGCGGGAAPGTPAPQPVQNAVPAITGVTPSIVLAGSTDVSLAVTGSGFVAASTVEFNGSPLSTTFASAASLTAILPAADLAKAGQASVSVVSPSPGGGTSAAVPLPVNNPVPEISQINPANVIAGSGPLTLDVKGSGFVSSSQISWNGGLLPTTVVSGTEATAGLAATAVSGSSSDSVTVVNPGPGGGAAPVLAYTITSPTPVLKAVSPKILPLGTATTVTLSGTGFESNSMGLWNGAGRPTAFVDAGTLQVNLTAADLGTAGSGSLSVSNPGPGAAISSVTAVPISSQTLPTITGLTIFKNTVLLTGCQLLGFNLTGTNFSSNSTVQVNGTKLPSQTVSGDSQNFSGYLPAGFFSKTGGLSFTVTTPGQPTVVSDPFTLPANAPTILSLCPTPTSPTVYPASTFTINVVLSAVNATGSEQVSIGALPAGITTTTPTASASTGTAALHFQASASVTPGSYSVALTTTSGQLTNVTTLPLTVSQGSVPAFFFSAPLSLEVGVATGGSGSIQFGTSVSAPDGTVFDVTPSVTGLPPKTSATFSPTVFSPGQAVTVTVTAASDAPVAQNVPITLVGTPAAQVPAATSGFLVEVTSPPGTLANNRTDFVPIAGTPYAAVYDQAHDLIFASNPDWNRVDVISNKTHQVVKHIPLRSPRGLDITQDGTRVWVQSASRSLYAISTETLQFQTYSLPNSSFLPSGADVRSGSGTNRLYALSDGTLFLYYDDYGYGGSARVGVWNPQTNALQVLSTGPVSAWSLPVRSGDGSRVYAANDLYAQGIELYDVASQALSVLNASTSYSPVVAVNHDGSRLVLTESQGLGLYDASLTRLGTVPGTLTGFGIGSPLNGGVVFGPDGSKMYTVGIYEGLNVIVTSDANSLQVLGTAPALFTDPVGTSGFSGLTTPFALDPTGLVLGIQNYGIAFEDATFYQHYTTAQTQGNGEGEYIATYAGPLAGGPVPIFGEYGPLTPDIWFGQTRGSTSFDMNTLNFTAPPSNAPGPVNVKLIFPDGTQHFYPQLYSYGTNPQYAVTSGSSPQGGAAGTVLGYGLPQDASGSTVTVGANTATITTVPTQYPPFGGEPYPSTLLNFTFPANPPGLADLTVTSPIGAGTLPKAITYANEVTDYSSADTFNAILLDRGRNQLYLSAGDHIDVFSLASRQFVTPLHPAALGANSNFTGLALTPDGSQLLAANLLDGSLAVLNPDGPGSGLAIPIATPVTPPATCAEGPLYVAATSTSQAFVITGSLPGMACGNNVITYLVDLQARTATQPNPYPACSITAAPYTDSFSVESSLDGNTVVLGGSPSSSTCVYTASTSTYASLGVPAGPVGSYAGISISGDGNVVGSNRAFVDMGSGNFVGSVSHPVPFYGSQSAQTPPTRLHPKLNDAGSLYYFAFPNFFEIVDVQHAVLRMRFALSETVLDTATAMALDAGGRSVYLLTDKGLTLIDLVSAPLSIGHLSQTSAAGGTKITVRGSGFDAGTSATVGGLAAVVSVTDENTLSVTVPSLTSGTYDLTLTRGNGEVYTLDSGIRVP